MRLCTLVQALVDPWQCGSNGEETTAWQWLIRAWKETEMEPGSRAAHAAAVNQSHSWLLRACASAVTGPGPPMGLAALWFVTPLIHLGTFSCVMEQEQSHCGGCTLSFQQMLLS